MARSGGRWHDLPRRLGKHETVKRRYYRWIEMCVLDGILAAPARESDLEWLMIDSTIVRAHQQAAGARREKGGGCELDPGFRTIGYGEMSCSVATDGARNDEVTQEV
jgi:transposase